MDEIQTEAVRKDNGWSINRIPPTAVYTVRAANAPAGRNDVSVVSVSNIVLRDDSVTCARCHSSRGWQGTVKL
ncbi:MAG: hypothetical protein LUQ09_00770 [Methanomassiliicoccales archaeon]|nr:hypothetical protein [Methanomassiliicoccales archaeon]